jgi:LysM repeat protein
LGTPTSPPGVSATTPAKPTAPPESQSSTSNMMGSLVPPPAVAAAGGAVSPAPNPADSLLQSKFAAFMDAVRKKLDEGKLADAHLALSTLYGNPDLPADQAKQINNLLDQLAGTVIYSRKHYLEPPYVTQPGDTLERIAQKYSVPWQLLGRINGLMPPDAANTNNATKDQPLPVGMELKVVRGPFEAIVHLDRHELTLMVRNRYAGRFPIGVGRDQPKLDGNYTVRDKTPNPPYHGPDGVNVNPGDPRNPLGDAWIGLSDRIGIHGTSDPRSVGRDDNRGTICVGNRDLQDLYGILSVGSRVTILR